ncbi:MAG: hypothetical protein ACRD3W_22105, partial [Terriglobales bacterium]
MAALILSGCGGKKQAKISTPPPPPMAAPATVPTPNASAPKPPGTPPLTGENKKPEKADEAASALSL